MVILVAVTSFIDLKTFTVFHFFSTHLSFSSHTGSPRPQDTEIEEGPSGVKSTVCPVCEEAIHGSGEELNAHVEACLRRVRGCLLTLSHSGPFLGRYGSLDQYVSAYNVCQC